MSGSNFTKRIRKRDVGDQTSDTKEENEGTFQKIWNYVKNEVIRIVISTVVGWFIG